MNNIKMVIMVGVLLVLAVGLASAHEHNFAETEQLIDSGISCDKLTDEQLEEIGEYYMEQMHPGESHDLMHRMMGMEEGTEYHRQFHVNIARMMYCGEGGMMGGNMMGSGGMMGMMPMMMNMMGSGGMGMMGNYPSYGIMGNNPMGFGYSYWSF